MQSGVKAFTFLSLRAPDVGVQVLHGAEVAAARHVCPRQPGQETSKWRSDAFSGMVQGMAEGKK